jgi:ATP-dependent helicase IRC3
MQLKEIKENTDWIAEELRQSAKGLFFRRYDTFLEWFGMTNKRKYEILDKVDYQLKKNAVTLWCGNEERFSVSNFNRGETITFRTNEATNGVNGFANAGSKMVNYKNAGTIQVVNEESGLTLYKHQEEAIESLNNSITKTNKNPFKGLLVLPTGGGKTLTAAYWLSKTLLEKNKKILWIAHRHELLEQAKVTFHERLAYKDVFPSRHSFNYRIISGIHDKPINIKPTDDIIISSKDSLNAGFEHLYNNWIKDRTNEIFLIIDEAHHATAKTYRKLINNLQDKVDQFRMIGLTATPFRTAEDEQGLLAKVFPDDIIYKIDLRTLISRGILSEPIFEEVETNFDILKELTEDEIDRLNYFDIESIGRETAKTIAENDERNWFIVNRYSNNKNKYKQTIVFALNVFNAIALNKLFQEEGIKSDFVISTIRDMATGVNIKKDNPEIINRFRKGELDVLINVNILTEGTDLPNVQSIFLARPTISPILMTQMIGRGLRGEKAGGTKEAYIVSFIDDWKDKVSWVNPEKLNIEENLFNDKEEETKKKIIRLVAINKIEEFAILTNKILDATTKEALEKLNFIERLPMGIYHFSLLPYHETEEKEKPEKNCEVLVYDNIKQSYDDFINALPDFFKRNNLTTKDFFTEVELNTLSEKIEKDFFFGCIKYPGYSQQDIKDILQYYAQNEIEPKYIELKDRAKYNIDQIAKEIIDKDLGEKAQKEMIDSLWENNETEWKAFFGYNRKYFINEINLAKTKLKYPEEYKRSNIVPTDTKELRRLEEMSMDNIRTENPQYWKWLSDNVYEKHKDEEGFYFSALSGKKSRSKNKLNFQIDHIKPMNPNTGKGGLTTLDNLQLLTRAENAQKGAKS